MIMRMNLKYFGGRGASSSRGSGGGSGGINSIKNIYTLTDDEGNYIGKLYNVDGQTFLENTRGTINDLPLSIDEYISRVKNSGGSADRMSQKDIKAEMQRNAEYRKAMDKMLDQAYANDKDMKQGSRASRNTNRGARR